MEKRGGVDDLVEGTLAKIIARFIFPALLTGAVSFLAWYVKSSQDKSDAHTIQLEHVMSNQDRLADRVGAVFDKLSSSLAETRRIADDHEQRLRDVERLERARATVRP